MDKGAIAGYFDGLASHWDEDLKTDDAKINLILDKAGVKRGSAVLDVACGTGVLFPYYLSRDVKRVTGVDISREMLKVAAGKFSDSRISLLCGDVEALTPDDEYDCCVIYNAFPHFPDPEALILSLSSWIRPGGRLTVAHGMGLEHLHRIHAGSALLYSREMLPANELASLMSKLFEVDVTISDEGKYIVSGSLIKANG